MSNVYQSQREVSTTEFIKATHDLTKNILERYQHIPKKLKSLYHTYLIDPAFRAYNCVKMGNSIYVSNPSTKSERHEMFNKSRLYLQAMTSNVEMLYSIYHHDLFSNSQMEQVSINLHYAIKLIKGVIDSDKRRYKNI